MVRPEKVAVVAEVKEGLEKAKAVILTDFKGLSVQELGDLRRRLGKLGTEYRVVKNTLIRRAVSEVDVEGLAKYLDGPTALAFGYDDTAATAKTLVEFGEDFPALTVKAAWLDGQVVEAEYVKAIAKLPSRDELLGLLVSGLNAPLSGLVNVLQGPVQKLAHLLGAITESKRAESGT